MVSYQELCNTEPVRMFGFCSGVFWHVVACHQVTSLCVLTRCIDLILKSQNVQKNPSALKGETTLSQLKGTNYPVMLGHIPEQRRSICI